MQTTNRQTAAVAPTMSKGEREDRQRPRSDPILLKALKANLAQASEPQLRKRLREAISRLADVRRNT
jgi:hypothetical protein